VLDTGGRSTTRTGRFTPGYPFYRMLCGLYFRSVGGAEILASTGIPSPDRIALSKSLYGLSYHLPITIIHQGLTPA